MDKFTKWIEAKPIKKLNGLTPVTFITDITIRYGIPHIIITDNGTNFAIECKSPPKILQLMQYVPRYLLY